MFENLCDIEEFWLVVLNDTGVGRDADLAVGKGIERLKGLVGVDTSRQKDMNFDIFCRAVFQPGDADFALLVSLENRIAQA